MQDNWTPYLAQIQKVIDQLGGVEMPEKYSPKISEEKGEYIIDYEEPL
ncbi:MAG: hypothetical protein UZ14_CFX002002331 [Chloroflexi bacterium OLB14]|nr:MAG: hypothetical protein UZ14_CFX002002331 [Chloroflexi bacterium OLB14]